MVWLLRVLDTTKKSVFYLTVYFIIFVLTSSSKHNNNNGSYVSCFATNNNSFNSQYNSRRIKQQQEQQRQQQSQQKRIPFITTRLQQEATSASLSNNDKKYSYYEKIIPNDLPYRDDVIIALNAVRKACDITMQLQPDYNENDIKNHESTGGTISQVSKKDLSPVTVADFAVQALILHELEQHFPNDSYIAEEDSQSLQCDNNLAQQVKDVTKLLSIEETLYAIDLGKSYMKWDNNNNKRPKRVWCLDPIDGTRGFLRGKRTGGQYAIALALIENGIPVIGILGCPNLPIDNNTNNYQWADNENEQSNTNRGCIFIASKGGGCYQIPVHRNNDDDDDDNVMLQRLHVTNINNRNVDDARFCIGVEKYSDAQGQAASMASYIHGGIDRALNENGEIIRAQRIDSQAKHGIIARGDAELYIRLPKPGYIEWIWDHAAGNVVITEAGGCMTDTNGNIIDFSLGSQLSSNVQGVLMSSGGQFHTKLVEAYAYVSKNMIK